MHGSAIAAGDLNGDGILDLVVTNATPGDNADVSILLGIQGGGFEPAHNLTLGSLSNQAFLVDMNHDGKLDLVEDGGVALGDGHGSFGNLTPFPNGIGLSGTNTQLAVGDLNNDGIPDLAVAYNPPPYEDTPEVLSLLNNGKGDFTATSLTGLISYPAVYDFQSVIGVAIGKLQGNNADIVLANSFSFDDFSPGASAITLVGDGKGSFQFGNELSVPNSFVGYGGAAIIADFNHDGYNDIGILAGDDFSVITGPSFTREKGFLTTGGTKYFSGGIAVANFNGDGWLDVVTANDYGVARLYNVPVPNVSPGSLYFTSSGTKTVSIKNTLKIYQSITAPVSGSSDFRISGNTCGASLAPGASCTISIGFTSAAGSQSATLYLSANGAVIADIPLSGN
jgi:hypothetical protein